MRRYDVDPSWLEELFELLRMPSISTDPHHDGDVQAAAEWVRDAVRRAGGEADLVPTARHPLVIGQVPASTGAAAPTVLLYGHFDVQPTGPVEAWTSPPFEPEVRDDWLYARGATDDKGNLFMLLKATELLSRSGRLPVNVLFACDGEEESGGDSILTYITDNITTADAAVLFDGPMPAFDLPGFKLATRGLIYIHVALRSGRRDLHSGVYGGAALNAVDALLDVLNAVRSLPPALRGEPAQVTSAELSDRSRLPTGAEALADQDARPVADRAYSDFYGVTTTETSLDIHGIQAGEAVFTKTIIPAQAEASFSIRVVPGQDAHAVAERCVELMRAAAPPRAELEIDVRSAVGASMTDPDSDVIRLGLAAFERALGQRPLLIRSGGTVPVRAALTQADIPTIHAGFDVPAGNAHAPDERLYAPYLGAGIAAATELLVELQGLTPRPAA